MKFEYATTCKVIFPTALFSILGTTRFAHLVVTRAGRLVDLWVRTIKPLKRFRQQSSLRHDYSPSRCRETRAGWPGLVLWQLCFFFLRHQKQCACAQYSPWREIDTHWLSRHIQLCVRMQATVRSRPHVQYDVPGCKMACIAFDKKRLGP